MDPSDRHIYGFVIHRNKQDIRGQLQEYRSRPAHGGLAESNRKIFRNPFGIITGGAPFGHGFHHINLIHFLQSPGQIIP